jgi:XTP/dITP diphosphohydrolase
LLTIASLRCTVPADMNKPAAITILVATRNLHKVGEIRSLLGAGCQCLTLNDCPSAPQTIEDAATFAGNATKKVWELARWFAPRISNFAPRVSSPAFVVADDSGLEVDALDGAPGVHSARFAALDAGTSGNASDAENNAKLLRLLKDVPPEKRTARFRCVLALAAVDSSRTQAGRSIQQRCRPELKLFEGECEGRIGFAPRGRHGFGYDPLFVPHGHERTFAELGEATKNQLSHRALALAKLRVWLERQVREPCP